MEEEKDLNNEEGIVEVELTKEDIEKLIEKYMNQNITIEDMIKRHKDEEEVVKKSFEASYNNWKLVNANRKNMVSFLRGCKRRLQFNMLIMSILYGIDEEINHDSVRIIGETGNKLSYEKSLLKEIKDSLNTLKKYKILDPLIEINVLMKLINDKNELIMDCLKDDLSANSYALSGIGFIPGTKNKTELDETNTKIDQYIKQLGFKNN